MGGDDRVLLRDQGERRRPHRNVLGKQRARVRDRCGRGNAVEGHRGSQRRRAGPMGPRTEGRHHRPRPHLAGQRGPVSYTHLRAHET
eukprot:6785054-Heterocapsa_arctica.AAC.1